MNPSQLTLRPAALADISAMMAIERSPDYELYVARSDEEEHGAMLSSPSHAYRVGVGRSGEGGGDSGSARRPAEDPARRRGTGTAASAVLAGWSRGRLGIV